MKRNYRQHNTPQTIDFTKVTIDLSRTLEAFQKQYDQLTRIIKLCDCDPTIKEFLLEYAKDTYAKENSKGPSHFEALLKDSRLNIQNLNINDYINPNQELDEEIAKCLFDINEKSWCYYITNKTKPDKKHALAIYVNEEDIITKIKTYHS